MVSAILAPAGATFHNELSSLFSTVISQNRAQGEKNLRILHYIVPHKRESIYPIRGNPMVTSTAQRGENKRTGLRKADPNEAVTKLVPSAEADSVCSTSDLLALPCRASTCRHFVVQFDGRQSPSIGRHPDRSRFSGGGKRSARNG
jgi:hypothetical protein